MDHTIQNVVALADVEVIDIAGKRWTDSVGSTYHSVQVSVLLKGADKYIDIGFNPFSYGYDRCYEQTALTIIKDGITGWNPKENAMHWIADEYQIKIDSHYEDVKRKKDL